MIVKCPSILESLASVVNLFIQTIFSIKTFAGKYFTSFLVVKKKLFGSSDQCFIRKCDIQFTCSPSIHKNQWAVTTETKLVFPLQKTVINNIGSVQEYYRYQLSTLSVCD